MKKMIKCRKNWVDNERSLRSDRKRHRETKRKKRDRLIKRNENKINGN